MRTHLSTSREKYDGSQLAGGWLSRRFGLEPDAVAAFTGPCDVAREHMIDLDDLNAGETIVAADMLHLIVEHTRQERRAGSKKEDDGDQPPLMSPPSFFDLHSSFLTSMALRQRMLVVCVKEAVEAARLEVRLVRDGDDLFASAAAGVAHVEEAQPAADERRKLTVSIATRSRSRGTGLIHLGINIDPEGAPVPAVGLSELGVDPARLATDVMQRYARELDSVAHAAGKVREAK